MLNLDPKYVKIIKEILLEHIPATLVLAYGSRVKGQSHQGSDLDLVIFPQEGMSPEVMIALREAFADSDLPILIDIVEWDSIPEIFKQEIQKKHFILQNPL